MAEYNLIQRGELQQRLVQGLVIKERSPAPTLSPDVQAVVLLEDLTRQTPFNQPINRRLFSNARVAPVAGLIPGHFISNPAGSGVIALVETVFAATTTDSRRFGKLTGALPGPLGSIDWFDRRNNPPLFAVGQGALFARANSSFAATQIATPLYTTINMAQPYDVNMILLPGESFGVERETVNTQLDSTILWTEFSA